MDDVVRNLGLLTLGTRLKRIGERLQADTQEIMDGFDLPLAAGQFPHLAALDRLGPLGIGELAQVLGVAQPGVTRAVAQLGDLGLVDITGAKDDQRRRIVALSPAGRRLIEDAGARIWPVIEGAVADLCGADGEALLALLGRIEDGLGARSLAQRAKSVGRAS